MANWNFAFSEVLRKPKGSLRVQPCLFRLFGTFGQFGQTKSQSPKSWAGTHWKHLNIFLYNLNHLWDNQAKKLSLSGVISVLVYCKHKGKWWKLAPSQVNHVPVYREGNSKFSSQNFASSEAIVLKAIWAWN